MLQFICYTKCSTCQKAKKWLEENQVLFSERPIKEQNPNYEELSTWLKKSGSPVKKLFNTSGLLYKSQHIKEKIDKLSEEDLLKILGSDGMMVKRPILVGEDFALFGFREEEWKKAINGHSSL
jgi:arsenate reductase